jgi:hypothetical protein
MEYANAAMSIGGKIKRSEIERLAQAIEDDGTGTDWTDTLNADEAIEEIEKRAAGSQHISLFHCDQPWGRFEAVETVCRELGLTYVSECEAGGEWHPMLEYWTPAHGDKPRQWPIAEIGRGPMIDAEDIQKHLDAGTLADEIALMTTVHRFPWKLEIVEGGEAE